jgi:hypothetical protein
VIGIALSGPGFSFEDHEGMILIPTQSDLYNAGGTTASGQPAVPANQMFGTDRIDVSRGTIAHGGIVAASSSYGSSSIFGSTPTSSAVQANVHAQAAGTTADLQGAPMSVSAAQAWCLYNCQGAAAKPNGAAVVAVVVVAAAAVIAVVGIAMVLTRRRARPPQTAYQAPQTMQNPAYRTYNLPPPPPPGA